MLLSSQSGLMCDDCPAFPEISQPDQGVAMVYGTSNTAWTNTLLNCTQANSTTARAPRMDSHELA